MSTSRYRLAVGFMMLNSNNEVFVAERLKPKNAWQMPQGGIEENESPTEALHREALEEIGTTNFEIIAESRKWYAYEFPLKLKSTWFDGKYIGQKQKWFLLEFLGKDQDINIHSDEPEFKDWKWVSLKQLLELIVDFKKPMYSEIVDEFKPLIFKSNNEVI